MVHTFFLSQTQENLLHFFNAHTHGHTQLEWHLKRKMGAIHCQYITSFNNKQGDNRA